MGQADKISEIRRFPIYDGRFLATWTTDQANHLVTLLEIIDAKYPKQLRQFQMLIDPDDK